MNEQELIEKLDPKVSEPQIDLPAEGAVTPDIDVQTKLDLYNQLGLDMNLLNDEHTSKQVIDIYNWLQTIKPGADTLDMMMISQEVLNKIGRTDNSPLERLWDYMNIDRQIRFLTSQRKGMENG